MAAEEKTNKNSFSLDWLIGGVLSKLGDTFDRFTGRNWNPSSSLATSKLVEKLKFLLDSEVRDLGAEGKFVPHIITLKMQWNKFSTESETEIEKLEHELHAAAIDHINDKLYHTYAPLEIEIKTDYFTEGVRMLANYGKFSESIEEEAAINVTIPNMQIDGLIKDNRINVNLNEEEIKAEPKTDTFFAGFTINGKTKKVELNFAEKKRISVGRFKENDLSIPDQSVSKVHASLVLNEEKQLLVADTGSTNGTFVNNERIAYGKAVPVENGAKIKFGTIEVEFEKAEEPENLPLESDESTIPVTEVFKISDDEIKSQIESKQAESPAEKSSVEQTALDSTAAEIPQTEAEIKSAAESVPETLQISNREESLEKAEKNVSAEEKKESTRSENKEKESQNETENIDKTRKINLDKTQDWEI